MLTDWLEKNLCSIQNNEECWKTDLIIIFFKDERTWHWTRWKTHLLRTTLRNVRQPVIPTWASWLLSLQICSLRTCEWSSSLFVKVRWFSISLNYITSKSSPLRNYFLWQSWVWAMEFDWSAFCSVLNFSLFEQNSKQSKMWTSQSSYLRNKYLWILEKN